MSLGHITTHGSLLYTCKLQLVVLWPAELVVRNKTVLIAIFVGENVLNELILVWNIAASGTLWHLLLQVFTQLKEKMLVFS